LELAQMVQLEAHRATREIEVLRDLNQGSQSHTVQRRGISPPERPEVDLVTMKTSQHGETGKPTFRSFRLIDGR
jgi:hypothetical protein